MMAELQQISEVIESFNNDFFERDVAELIKCLTEISNLRKEYINLKIELIESEWCEWCIK